MARIPTILKTIIHKSVDSNRIRPFPYFLHIKKAINDKRVSSVLVGFLLFGSFSFSQDKSIRIIVESLPGNTPPEDTIFVCGNFNNWDINDPDYRLKRQADGRLFVTFPQNRDTIEYKFSRGDWMKMETNSENAYLPNRQLTGDINEPVMIRIKNWQDIGGQRSLPLSVLILSAAILNGIFLIILIKNKVQKYDQKKTSRTIIWSLFLITTLLGAVLFEFANPVWKFRLMLGFEILLFLGAPLFLLVCKSFYTDKETFSFLHWVPALFVFLFNIFRFAGIWQAQWLQIPIIKDLFIPDIFLISLGSLLSACYIVIYSLKLFCEKKKNTKNHEINESPTLSSIPDITIVSERKHNRRWLPEWSFLGIAAAINFLALGSGIILFVLNASNRLVIQSYQDIPLSIASLQLFVIFYYVYFNETVFLPQKPSLRNDLNQQLAGKILNFMQNQKPYLDTDLTLAAFAERLEDKPHNISKTVNDYFDKNFRDFLNEFRVNEFIQKMESGEAKNRTFLYLAHEAGFNSKSTFNLAFRKATGLSPREYFNTKK
jgi:AraC-like DNA-binding protein